MKKRKNNICRFCNEKTEIDYKNTALLKRFITERGRILPKKITKLCNKHQHRLTQAIKRARILALLPFVAR